MTAETDATTLQQDIEVILLHCHRDRPELFAAPAADALPELAAHVAHRLGALIGGRHVSQQYASSRMARERRDAAVWAAFTGKNYDELRRRFGLSRRLVYAIIAQQRKKLSM